MKYLYQIKTIVPIILVVMIFEFLNKYFTCSLFSEEFKNQDSLLIIQIIVTIIGGAWALRLYYITNIKDKKNYLKTYVSVRNENEFITIKTEVKNETKRDRKINASFIIITKQGDNILEEVNKELRQEFESTTEFVNLKRTKSVIKPSFAFIHLPYYYSENIKVGNEDLSFSIGGFESSNSESRTKQIYEVRFFVYRNVDDINYYHRSVQTCFSTCINLNALFEDYAKNSPEPGKTFSNTKKASK